MFLTIGYFLVSQHLWKVSVERRKLTVALIVITAFTVAVPALPSLSLAPGLALKLGYLACCVVALVIGGAVDRREVAVMGDGLRRFAFRQRPREAS